MAPGARSKFGALVFEPVVFQKQMFCIEKSAGDMVATFRWPHSDSEPGNCVPLHPWLRPWPHL